MIGPPEGTAAPGYRPCVAMVVFDRDGHILVAQRSDREEPAWQLPQGGIDAGEEPREAARRELEEEIGTATVDFAAEAPGWVAYDIPTGLPDNPWQGRYRGQAVKLVAFRFTGRDADIDLDTETPEFSAWRWVELEDLPALAVAFKRPLYEAAVRCFAALRDSLRQQRNG